MIVFIFSSVMLFVEAIKREALLVLEGSPDLIVQRMRAGRHELIPAEYIYKLNDILGVSNVEGRLWANYFEPSTGANYTVMVAKERQVVKGVFPTQSELVSTDLIEINDKDFRELFAVPSNVFTDITLNVRNPFLIAISPFILGEAFIQAMYFINLKANVITSCCGSLFSADATGVSSALASLPVRPAMATFFGLMILTVATGLHFAVTGRSPGHICAAGATLALPVSAAAVATFISCYFYELPTHNCPTVSYSPNTALSAIWYISQFWAAPFGAQASEH